MHEKLTSPQAIKSHLETLRAQADYFQYFSYPVRLTAAANSTGRIQVPIGSNADFQVLGYNISHSAGTAGAIDVVSLKFSQSNGNRKWSNDFENLANIATPGVRNTANPVPRYGMRHFPGFVPANDVISIDWANTDASTAVVVDIEIVGILWFLDRIG